MTTTGQFINRLKKIGIDVTLINNYPWVYMTHINGHRIYEKYLANHGFTVFFRAYNIHNPHQEHITNISKIFNKIREVITFDGEVPQPPEDGYE
jgi:hypothetical protein